jgi:hypothetical protein
VPILFFFFIDTFEGIFNLNFIFFYADFLKIDYSKSVGAQLKIATWIFTDRFIELN